MTTMSRGYGAGCERAAQMPSRPGEFHLEPLTDPDVNLSIIRLVQSHEAYQSFFSGHVGDFDDSNRTQFPGQRRRRFALP
jgi:hypothetical protein